MVDVSALDALVNRYVECWKLQRPSYQGIYEDNDFGCEGFQIFRNDFRIEEFSHSEASQLAVLLTRSLRGQINRDHKLFWSWCSWLALNLRDKAGLFQDSNWIDACRSLVNLVLAAQRRLPVGPTFVDAQKRSLEHVNWHLLEVSMDKWLLSGPLACAVLEGMLRRKSGGHIGNDGKVLKAFDVVEQAGQTRKFDVGKRKRLNRIDDSLRLFEQVVIPARGRPCPMLGPLMNEIQGLYPNTIDAYELIDSWRNELVHGQQYWISRVPVILNVICLLIIDEIEPDIYDGKRNEIRQQLQWQSQSEALSGSRASWAIFPPNSGR